MLQLTLRSGDHVLIEPTHISVAVPRDSGCQLLTSDDETPWNILESTGDVARLKAVWERRHGAYGLNGELPIAVKMRDTGDGVDFLCCEHLRRLRLEQQATRRAAHPLRKLAALLPFCRG